MNDLPLWLRGPLLGTAWGAGCGAASAALVVFARVMTGGTTGDDAYQLLVGVPLEGGLACGAGAMLGGTLGLATGLVAGSALIVTLRLGSSRLASSTTIAVVLVVQTVTELAVVRRPTASSLWAFAVVPAITVLPLTYAVLGQVRAARSAAPA